MRALSVLSLRALWAVVLVCAVPVSAQSTRIDGGRVSQGQAFGFYWETHLEPAMPVLEDGFDASTTIVEGVIHRVMLDRERRVYFGYRVAVEVLRETNSYHLRFWPLTLTPGLARSLLGDDDARWTSLGGPTLDGLHWNSGRVAPLPGTVTLWSSPPFERATSVAAGIRSGDVLALTLLTNPATGQKIVDYVTVQEPGQPFRGFEIVPPREFAFAAGTPRDFSAADGELRIREPRVSIDGRLHESTIDARHDEAGAIVWMYVPGRGRFLLSLTPHPELGFERAGEVRGSALTFTAGDETFNVVTGGRIAGGAPFNLYVRHEPDWVPTYQHANRSAFIMGSADRAEWVVETR